MTNECLTTCTAILMAGGEIIFAWCVVGAQVGASYWTGRWDKL